MLHEPLDDVDDLFEFDGVFGVFEAFGEAGVGFGEEDEGEGVFHDAELVGDGLVGDVGVAGGEFGEGVAGDGGGCFEDVVVDTEGEAFAFAGEVAGGCGHGWDGRSILAMIVPGIVESL